MMDDFFGKERGIGRNVIVKKGCKRKGTGEERRNGGRVKRGRMKAMEGGIW